MTSIAQAQAVYIQALRDELARLQGAIAEPIAEPLAALSNRGQEWHDFARTVGHHIETYTVPQYGDAPGDQIENWTAEQCAKQIAKYAARFGRNARDEQDLLDMIKIAHYACLAYNKMKGGV